MTSPSIKAIKLILQFGGGVLLSLAFYVIAASLMERYFHLRENMVIMVEAQRLDAAYLNAVQAFDTRTDGWISSSFRLWAAL
jgi:hypothetical protein